MIFQDNVIKEYLKNVLFITGTPCGGKTSVSRLIGQKYGLPVYNIDDMFPAHLGMSDPVLQPNMNRSFSGADEFFGRTVDEYLGWLKGNTREQLDFVVLDLIRLARDGKVICDCHITPEQAEKLTDPPRAVFMIKEPSFLAEEYISRPDHEDFRRFMYSASDPGKAKALVSETLERLNRGTYDGVRNGEWFFIDRAEGLSIDKTVDKAAQYLGLAEPGDISVERVEKDSPRAAELLAFIGNCSWKEARENIAKGIRKWGFEENEAVFAAVSDGRIVGMTALLNSDYYPLPDIYPWVTCVFVSEECRGRRISEKLIGCANALAAKLGYEKTYIASPFFGLYERYGYSYVKDIVNYGGGTDRLFVKRL